MIYYLLVGLFLIVAGLGWALKFVWDKLKEAKANQAQLTIKWDEIQERYRDVIDLEEFKQKLTNEVADLKNQTVEAVNLNETLSRQADVIRKQLDIYSGEQTVVDCGLYTPVYDYDISQKYKDALEAVRDEQKTAIKQDKAATCSQAWTMNGDKKAGLKQSKAYSKLMLRAFNGESDAIIGNVKWNNVDRMIERLEGAFQAINKLEETHTIKIERNYFALKLKELRLTYEYQEKLKAEKDEQKRLQEQIREEERVKKEFEKKIRESEETENRSRLALEQAKQQLQFAQGAAEVERMNEKVRALEAQLAEALENTIRTKSRAEMTKAGNVYIISNIGSFGENRFKIGMTRRENPQDRIHELSDASVPFEFDVHAFIYTENAPKLEATLHERFKNKLVNLVNLQKEFFDVSLDELEAAVKEVDSSIELRRIPEAKSYRQTLALRGMQLKPLISEERTPVQQVASVDQSTSQPKEYQVYVLINEVQQGPYSFNQINQMLAAGQITSETMLWYEGQASWIPISQLQSQAN